MRRGGAVDESLIRVWEREKHMRRAYKLLPFLAPEEHFWWRWAEYKNIPQYTLFHRPGF
jgi:hypothetical protein